MIARCWFVLVAVHFLLTVGKCQWTVDVQLHQFENKYNAEMRESQFCCCDTNIKDSNCASDPSSIPKVCTDICDTWFDVSVTPCTATDQLRCSVSTKSQKIVDSPSVSVYGYVFHFASTTTPENLSITMWEEGEGGGDNEIDRFTVMLSSSAANHVATYTGENNVSEIVLSYQIHCMNLDGCPSILLNPESSSANIASVTLVTETANPTVCENRSIAPMMSSLIKDLECSSCPELLDTVSTQTVIWMAVAIVSLLLAIASLLILICILCCKKDVRKGMILNSKFTANERLTLNPNYDIPLGNAFSTKQAPDGPQDIYHEIDNSLYGSTSADEYTKEGPIKKINEGMYELATPEEMVGEKCYETSDPKS